MSHKLRNFGLITIGMIAGVAISLNISAIGRDEAKTAGGLPIEELRSWYSISGQPMKRFFNTSGQIYKSLGLKEKLSGLSEDEAIELLSTDGMLVKRPIIVDSSTLLIGFDEAHWTKQLL